MTDREDGDTRESRPHRRSASADAAALRWMEQHPDEDVELPPAPGSPGDSEQSSGRPRHRSASAEAAALRWSERHPDG